MLPEISEISTFEHGEKDYRLDTENDRITDMIDGAAALLQNIRKTLRTEKGAYKIYPTYGCALESLVGQDFLFTSAMAKKNITEALLADDRVLSVDDFTFETIGDSISTQFTVDTIFGKVNEGVSL